MEEECFHPFFLDIGDPLNQDSQGFRLDYPLPSMAVVHHSFRDVFHFAHPFVEQLIVLPPQRV